MDNRSVVAGIDVGKWQLHVHILPVDEAKTFVSDEDGVSVLALTDGAAIRLFDGSWLEVRWNGVGVSDGRRRVKPLRGSSAALRPFG